MSIFYVAKTGNDANAGTATAPFLTIQKAVDVAVAGDSIALPRTGETWYETITLDTMRGEGVSPITFLSHGAGPLPKISNYKIANAGSWVNTATNIWRIDLKDVTKFTGLQDVSGTACANVGFIRVDGVIYGQKRWGVTSSTYDGVTDPGLIAQWDFYSEQSSDNAGGQYLYVYSVGNPGSLADEICIAVGRRLITFASPATALSGVLLTGIEFVGCAGHWIGDACKYVRATGNHAHEIGGGQLYGRTRYGNGVQPGYTSIDVDIGHNLIGDVYDTCTTMQGNSFSVALTGWTDVNIHDNVLYRGEQAFETYAQNEPGTGGGGIIYTVASATPGPLYAASAATAGSAYYAGQQLRVIGATSGASNGVVTVSSVNGTGGITAVTVTTAGTGYTDGETATYQAISWSLDSSKGFVNTGFRDNVCVDIGRGWSHDVRPDQSVASPILFYKMDALNLDIEVTGNHFVNPRGPLITSGSSASLATIVGRGYTFAKNTAILLPTQKLYNLGTAYYPDDYAAFAAAYGLPGTDVMHQSHTDTDDKLSNTLQRITDMLADSGAIDSILRNSVFRIAGDLGALSGQVNSIDQRIIYGAGSPSLTASFSGQLYYDTTARAYHYALDQSGGAASWMQLADVGTGTSDPTFAAQRAGQFFVNTSSSFLFVALSTAGGSGSWLRLAKPPLTGSSDPTGTADFVGQLYFNTTAFTLHYSNNTSGGATSWRRLINVVETASAPSSAPPFAGRIYIDTSLGIPYLAKGTASTADWLQLSSFVATPPANSSSTGRAGQWSADASYVYVCYATNTWRRAAVSTF